MVSLWPWGGDDASPAAFERTLSQLQEKITKAQLLLDTLNQHARRRTALWTLYTSFAYILCVVILALVVGWRNWGPTEYTAVAASPVIMYGVRALLKWYYTYRIGSVTSYLDHLTTQRSATIDKLKAATKYNSTQQLLEKYGGVPAQKTRKEPRPRTNSLMGPGTSKSKAPKGRTSLGPPPATANIPRAQSMSAPNTPAPNHAQPVQAVKPPPLQRILPERDLAAQQAQQQAFMQQQAFQAQSQMQQFRSSTPSIAGSRPQTAQSEFAPNAFPPPPQAYEPASSSSEGKWYDRLLDIVMGEDETSPRNRIVLICENCRLVNGQAPPGVRRLEDVGLWRCFGCGAKNGVVDEGVKAVREMESVVRREERREMERKNSDGLRRGSFAAPGREPSPLGDVMEHHEGFAPVEGLEQRVSSREPSPRIEIQRGSDDEEEYERVKGNDSSE